jgi:ABC-2 type transport system ATP-binding protein/lipopolysaccharide transport system ATP-binding protein
MVAVTLEGVCIDYPVYGAESRSLKKSLLRGGMGSRVSHDAHHRITVHALHDISLQFREGDRIGLVGPNGAGKSTLLRTIAGIYEPARGRVRVHGRVTTLFSLNLGIEEEATGLENITLRGLAAGMTKREIERHAADIADFTELGEYLNFPILTYSTGMRARLAFAISTAIKPEILLMDEWIGAGDAGFIEKARGRLNSMVDEAGILVLASHNQNLIKRICSGIMELEAGHLKRAEPTEAFFGKESEKA